MTRASWAGQPFAVHIGADAAVVERLEREARRRGASIIRLDLAGVRDRSSLAETLARTFMFPHESRGLDAAIDLMSDLEWFGNRAGYLVIVEGLDQAREVVTAFASMLPNILDRWRSQGTNFVVTLVGAGTTNEAASALAAANSAMAAAGELPWAQPGTGAALVIRHS